MSDAKKIEDLNQRRQRLQIEHAKLSAQVDAARKEYAALSAEAEKQFGTAKVSELEAKMIKIKESNSAILQSAEAELSAAEAAIAKFKLDLAAA